MFGLGAPELIIILIVILVIFGGSQLPKLARNISSSAKELRNGLKDDSKVTKTTAIDVNKGKKDQSLTRFRDKRSALYAWSVLSCEVDLTLNDAITHNSSLTTHISHSQPWAIRGEGRR